MQGRVLIVAGSDSGGGAGIQGDLKTVTCLGGYGMTAITALTAQNTQGVFGIHPVPEEFIARQMELCLSDIGADAIKTGMLHSAGVIRTVARILLPYCSPLAGERAKREALSRGGADLLEPTQDLTSHPTAAPPHPNHSGSSLFHREPPLVPQGGREKLRGREKLIPLVVDPVMVAKGGAALLETDAVETLKSELLPLAALFTPNIPEAELLSGMTIRTVEEMERAAHLLHSSHGAVLIKGGHLEGAEVTDLLLDHDGIATRYTSPRIASTNTHGTGCALASAIATRLAQGMSLRNSVEQARAYVQEAIKAAPGFGHGHGPLGHGHTVSRFSG